MITPPTQDTLGDEVLERGMERLQLRGAGPGESPEPGAFSSERQQSPFIRAVPQSSLSSSSHAAPVPIDLGVERISMVFCVFSGNRNRLLLWD